MTLLVKEKEAVQLKQAKSMSIGKIINPTEEAPHDPFTRRPAYLEETKRSVSLRGSEAFIFVSSKGETKEEPKSKIVENLNKEGEVAQNGPSKKESESPNNSPLIDIGEATEYVSKAIRGGYNMYMDMLKDIDFVGQQSQPLAADSQTSRTLYYTANNNNN